MNASALSQQPNSACTLPPSAMNESSVQPASALPPNSLPHSAADASVATTSGQATDAMSTTVTTTPSQTAPIMNAGMSTVTSSAQLKATPNISIKQDSICTDDSSQDSFKAAPPAASKPEMTKQASHIHSLHSPFTFTTKYWYLLFLPLLPSN